MAAPTAYEQYMLELVNQARADPNLEAQWLGIDLNENLPAGTLDGSYKQPLAFSYPLNDAAYLNSQAMLDYNYFSHTGYDGSTPTERMFAAGWTYDSGGYRTGENIAWVGSTVSDTGYNASTIEQHHDGLFLSSGHRVNILNGNFSEIGIGQAVGSYTHSNGVTYNYSSMATQNFADGGREFITGVVIDDYDGDEFYDIGEGLGGVSITAQGSNGTYSTQTWDAGGYSLWVTPGSYTVTFSGGSLSQAYSTQVTVGEDNVKLDAINDQSGWVDDGSQIGSAGSDYFYMTAGDDVIYGGDGLDYADFGVIGSEATYQNGDPVYVYGDTIGTDTLFDVERLVFNNGTMALDTDYGENAGQAYRIYQAAFARTPDTSGLSYWIESIDQGSSLYDVSWGFIGSDEFRSIYGSNPTYDDFVERLYWNVLGREGEADGIAYWTEQLYSGRKDAAEVLAGFSESNENVSNLAPTIDDGIWYT